MTANSSHTTAVPPARIVRAWALAALWTAFVWGLGGDDLSLEGTSRFLGPLFAFLLPGISEATNEQLQWAVRKAAHVTEYAVMSGLVVRAFWLSGRPRGHAATWSAIAFACLFAAADETRQSWSAARLGSVTDVGLDASGAVLGVAIATIVRARWPALGASLGLRPDDAPRDTPSPHPHRPTPPPPNGDRE